MSEREDGAELCGLSWSTLAAQHPDWLSRGVVRALVQEDTKGRPELNTMGVPLAVKFSRTAEDRSVMELFYSQNRLRRPLAAPQSIPVDRLAALRSAFVRALSNKETLADVARMGLDVSPVPGKEVQSIVSKLYSLPPNVIKRAKQILIYRPPT